MCKRFLQPVSPNPEFVLKFEVEHLFLIGASRTADIIFEGDPSSGLRDKVSFIASLPKAIEKKLTLAILVLGVLATPGNSDETASN